VRTDMGSWAASARTHREAKQQYILPAPQCARTEKSCAALHRPHGIKGCRYSGSNRKIYTPTDLFYPARVAWSWLGLIGVVSPFLPLVLPSLITGHTARPASPVRRLLPRLRACLYSRCKYIYMQGASTSGRWLGACVYVCVMCLEYKTCVWV
jgi:hypothetical protein